MATLKLAVVPAKVAKDGTHKIRVAIGHKQKTCYIVTRFRIGSLSEFRDGRVVGREDSVMVNVKLRSLLNGYQDVLDSVKNVDLYDCSQLRGLLMNSGVLGNSGFLVNSGVLGNSGVASLDKTFQAVANRYVRELREDSRENYAILIERNCRYFTDFTRREFLLSDITPTVINNYSRFLRNSKRVGETTIGMMMSRTRTIINKAKREQLVSYEVDPFEFYSIAAAPERELDISVEELRLIRDSSPKSKIKIIARDLLMLSYYLGGINLVDLLKIDFRGLDSIEYVRTKSRNTKRGDKRICLSIPPEAVPIIIRWRGKRNGRLDFGYGLSYSNFSRYLSRNITELGLDLGIKSKVVYYSARKSFVQHGFELGIPLEVLEYCIGQSMKSNRPIFSYLKIMRSHADVAIRRILDNLS